MDPSKIKNGMKVRVSRNPISPELSPVFTREMDKFKGKVLTVDGVLDGDRFTTKGNAFYWSARWVEPARMTKALRLEIAREERAKAWRVAVEKKAKAAADRMAKRARARALKRLSPTGRKIADLLDSDRAALGCQRSFVVKLLSAITGDDLASIDAR